jgi:hypothetical protein
MSSRRDLLKVLSVLPAVASAQETKEKEDQPGHIHSGPAIKVPEPSQPTFLQPGEFQVVEAMSERIIPESDTPGAKKAGVALLIDKAIVARPILGHSYRAGVADLNALSISSFGGDFCSLTEVQQIAVLTPMSLETDTSLGKFFELVKDMTIDAYYKTEAGLKTELGWHGNTYLTEFPGCDHPEHHG